MFNGDIYKRKEKKVFKSDKKGRAALECNVRSYQPFKRGGLICNDISKHRL